MKIQRRDLVLALGGFVLTAKAAEAHTDKRTLLSLFDKANIDVSDPAIDHTPDAISISVNGDTVTGTEGGMVVFKFNPKGALIEVIVWNDKTSNSSVPQ